MSDRTAGHGSEKPPDGSRQRTAGPQPRPPIAAGDLLLSLALLGLWPLACALRPRSWHGVSRLLTEAKAAVLPGYPTSLARASRLAFPRESARFLRDIERNLDAHRRELRLQVLRKLTIRAWQPGIRLEGAEHLEQALLARRGAILWLSHFVFSGFVAKAALHDAGYRVTHVSRPEHGFSKTRFGIAVLNPLRCRVEDPYLDARVVLGSATMHATMRRLMDVLKANGVVSITAGAWEGRQLVTAPLFGGSLRLATGAPALAWSAGAALLPVHGVLLDGGEQFRVVIDAPLETDRALDKRAFVAEAALQYANRLAPFVLKYPGQWRGWSGL